MKKFIILPVANDNLAIFLLKSAVAVDLLVYELAVKLFSILKNEHSVSVHFTVQKLSFIFDPTTETTL
jgi:hypothetical protein